MKRVMIAGAGDPGNRASKTSPGSAAGKPENEEDPDAWSNATERRAILGSII